MDKYKYSVPDNYEGIVYQIIRPTGLLDPYIEVRPSLPETFFDLKESIKKSGLNDLPIMLESYWDRTQITDLMIEIQKRVAKKQRVLVTTLTKRMSEELSDFLNEKGIKSKYLHSEIDAVERVEILVDLRKGEYDVLIGINLLREGLDLPEVSLVAILDADKEGFLRSETSLIQIIGRAARHEDGTVIMYADKITESMKKAILETQRRRRIQQEHNQKYGIIPKSIRKEVHQMLDSSIDRENHKVASNSRSVEMERLQKQVEIFKTLSKAEQKKLVKEIKIQMQIYADMLDFDNAKILRDLLFSLQ